MPRIRDKDPREHNKAYLGFIASLPCVSCFVRTGRSVHPVQVAHIRQGYLGHEGWRPVGKAEKPHDWRTAPLCVTCHLTGRRAQHNTDEELWWDDLGIFPPDLCAALWACFERGARGGYAVIAGFAAKARRNIQGVAAP